MVAFVALGVSLVSNRGLWWKVLGGLVGVVAGVAFAVVVESAVGALVPDSAGWVQEEAGLWVSGVLAVALTLFRLRRAEPV